MTTTYTFSPSVKKMFTIASVLMALLGVTLPLAVYFFVMSRSAKLVRDAEGFTVSGLGLSSRWNFRDIARLGTLTVDVIGGGPLTELNGGARAVNLVGRTKGGKTLKFMLSRFERWEEILEDIQRETQLPLESVRPGVVGVAWPTAAAA